MKKSFSVFAVMMAIAFTISSCGKDDNNNSGGTASVLFKNNIKFDFSDPYAPAAGITVKLFNDANTVIGTKVTPANGEVTFNDLNAGNYEYEASYSTCPYEFDDGTFSLSAGENKTATTYINCY